MNVVKEQTGELSAVVKIQITPNDYQKKVDDALRLTQRKVQMPGFRPGKVPAGLVKKMHGKTILADEINKLLYDSVNKYIVENKIEILGHPLPKIDDSIDWDNQKDFEFQYDLGLAPQFDVELTNEKIDYYLVKIDEELINKYTGDITRRYGNVSNPEIVEGTDLVFAEFRELNSDGSIKEGGIFTQSHIAVDTLKNEAFKNKLIGSKKEDKVTANTSELSDNKTDLAAMLRIEKSLAEILNANFELTIQTISRIAPAELNTELFDKIYGPGVVANEAEFRAKLKQEIETMFAQDSDRKFKADTAQHLIKKLNFNLPDEFLKRWIVVANEKGVTQEQVNNEYPEYSNQLRFQLIENKVIRVNEIKVDAAEALEFTKQMFKEQYFKYNPEGIDDAFLTDAAQKTLAKEEDARKIYERIYDKKVLDFFKSKVKMNMVELPYDDYVKKLNEKN